MADDQTDGILKLPDTKNPIYEEVQKTTKDFWSWYRKLPDSYRKTMLKDLMKEDETKKARQQDEPSVPARIDREKAYKLVQQFWKWYSKLPRSFRDLIVKELKHDYSRSALPANVLVLWHMLKYIVDWPDSFGTTDWINERVESFIESLYLEKSYENLVRKYKIKQHYPM